MTLIIVTLFGLILGSFVNALVWRLRQQELRKEIPSSVSSAENNISSSLNDENLSILTGRSMCAECHHMLAAKDLVPLASWLFLVGRCRYCHQPISWQYPLVEALTGALFAVSYTSWPLSFNLTGVFIFGGWLVCLTAFMALMVYDVRWFLLPDRIVFPLIAFIVLEVLLRATILHAGLYFVIQAVLGAVCIAGLFLALHFFSGGSWIGFGDVKLSVALGLLAGSPLRAMLLLFVAAALGTLVAVPLLVRGRASAKTELPFGPFLLSSTIVVVLFGTSIIQWYLHLFYTQ